MKDTSLSKKVGEKYEAMINLKKGQYGFQLALTPAFQKELYNWIKSQDGTYMNLNVKVWDDKPIDSHNEAKGNAYQPQDVDLGGDSIPF